MYTEECIQTFLEKQEQLFDEPVAETYEEAEEFLEDCMAVVADSIDEVRKYLSGMGADVDGMSNEELEEASEVFALPDGKYLITRRVLTKAWAPGWWEVSGGAAQAGEASYDAVLREVKEETGMEVNKAEYLFSLPNIYVYSGFPVHTLDLFFRCTVADTLHYKAMDDAADLFFIPLKEIRTEDFGLGSIRKGLGIFLKEMSE